MHPVARGDDRVHPDAREHHEHDRDRDQFPAKIGHDSFFPLAVGGLGRRRLLHGRLTLCRPPMAARETSMRTLSAVLHLDDVATELRHLSVNAAGGDHAIAHLQRIENACTFCCLRFIGSRMMK